MDISPISKALHTVITYPLRLLGSKNFSIPGLLFRLPQIIYSHLSHTNTQSLYNDLFCPAGYHRFEKQTINQEEAKNYLPFASACATVHANNPAWVKSFGYTPVPCEQFGQIGTDLEKKEFVFFDKSTGLKVVVLKKEDEFIVVFGALGSHNSQFSKEENSNSKSIQRSVITHAIGSLVGTRPELYKKAEKFISELTQSELCKNKKMTLCGQCLGGSVASYVSLRLEIPAICLNTFPLGPGLQRKIDTEKLQNADKWLTHVSANNDYFSDLPKFVLITDLFLSSLGLRTAGNFGKKLVVDSIFSNPFENHNCIYGALAAKWRPDFTSLCLNMMAKNREQASCAKEQLLQAVSDAL